MCSSDHPHHWIMDFVVCESTHKFHHEYYAELPIEMKLSYMDYIKHAYIDYIFTLTNI